MIYGTVGFFIFLLGISVGSFLNVAIYRLPKELSVFSGRSFCPKCTKKLSWWELIPLFSFFVLKGRCAGCGAKISWHYPLVELLTGVVFFLIGNKFAFSSLQDYRITAVALFYYFFIAAILLIIFFIDLDHLIIPDSLIVLGSCASLLYLGWATFFKKTGFVVKNSLFDVFFPWLGFLEDSFFSSSVFLNHLFFAIIGGVLFGLIILFTQGKGMGVGDLKLSVLMGLILGPRLIPALYLAFVSGAVVGIFLIVFKKKSVKSKIPFGPFLVGATLLFIIL